MIPGLDIYRNASVLVKQHGKDAPIAAALRADAMLEKDGLSGYAFWKRILRAAEELERAELGGGETRHSLTYLTYLPIGPSIGPPRQTTFLPAAKVRQVFSMLSQRPLLL